MIPFLGSPKNSDFQQKRVQILKASSFSPFHYCFSLKLYDFLQIKSQGTVQIENKESKMSPNLTSLENRLKVHNLIKKVI